MRRTVLWDADLRRLVYKDETGRYTRITLPSIGGGGGGGSGAPTGAEYVVATGHAGLSAERVLSVSGDGLQLTTSTGAITVSSYFANAQLVLGRTTAGAGAGEELSVHNVLDWITTTRGSLLYRGAFDWFGLAPSPTAGWVLTSNGTGADPTYQALPGPSGSAGGDLSGTYPNPVVDVARGLRESGGAEYPMGAVASGQVLRESGGSIVGIDAATLVATADPDPVRPTFSTQLYDDANLTAATIGSSAFTVNLIHFVLHVERQDASTYDAIVFRTTAGGGAGAFAKVGLYSVGTNGNPDALLWYSADVDTSAAGTFTSTFAGGTWTTAGNSYKDGSSRLTLTRGQAVWRAWMRNSTGAVSTQSVSVNALRGYSNVTLMNTQFVGFTVSRTFNLGFPDPAGSPTSLQTGLPSLPLRWV